MNSQPALSILVIYYQNWQENGLLILFIMTVRIIEQVWRNNSEFFLELRNRIIEAKAKRGIMFSGLYSM